MNIKFLSKLALASAALLLPRFANASPITGSIGFNGTPVFNSSPISGATGVTGYTFAYVAPGQQTGDYASVPNFTGVTFAPFSFSDATIAPLWSFSSGGLAYTFNATSVTANYDSVTNLWNLGGQGLAKITGFEDTVGTWNFSAGNQGASYTFLSNAAMKVPDAGSSALLVIVGLTVFGLAARRRQV